MLVNTFLNYWNMPICPLYPCSNFKDIKEAIPIHLGFSSMINK